MKNNKKNKQNYLKEILKKEKFPKQLYMSLFTYKDISYPLCAYIEFLKYKLKKQGINYKIVNGKVTIWNKRKYINIENNKYEQYNFLEAYYKFMYL